MTSHDRGDRDDQLLTVADIAGHIGAHEQTVRGWIHSAELKASKFGTRIGWRIRRADYDAFLRRRQLTGAITRTTLRTVSWVAPNSRATARSPSRFARFETSSQHSRECAVIWRLWDICQSQIVASSAGEDPDKGRGLAAGPQ